MEALLDKFKTTFRDYLLQQLNKSQLSHSEKILKYIIENNLIENKYMSSSYNNFIIICFHLSRDMIFNQYYSEKTFRLVTNIENRVNTDYMKIHKLTDFINDEDESNLDIPKNTNDVCVMPALISQSMADNTIEVIEKGITIKFN
jgi:hypothetical protein